MPALLINGVDAETYGFTLSEAPGWSDMPESQVVTAAVIGRQGVKDLADPQEQPRKLSLRGMVRGSSVADARTKLDALKLALAAKPVQFTFADQPTRYINARRTSFTSPPLTGSLVQGAMPVDATFICSDPYFYDALLAGVFINYSPGDTITGETFTRASTAFQQNAAGVYVSVGNNVKRDSHYIGGVRSLLLEGARTNSCVRSNDQANAAWAQVGTGSAVLNAVGLDGSANSATTLTDTDAAVVTRWSQSVAVPADSNTHAISWWVKKDAVVSRFPMLFAQITGGTSVINSVWLNTQTGAFVQANNVGTVTSRVIDAGLWWIVEITLTNNSTALNTTLTWFVEPARGTTIGVDSVAATGACVSGNVQVELNATFGTSPIITAGATVTRAADTYSLPHYALPQEMSVYTSHIELGTELGANITGLYDLGGGIPNLILYRNSTAGLQSGLTTAAGGVVSPLIGATAAIGDLVEVVQGLASDGSTSSTKTLNNGAESAPAASAALALPPAWGAPAFYPNGDGSFVNRGFAAFRSIKLAARIRSLAELRALPKMPLGTGVVRPLVRINGAAVNPVITLYNKAGVAVASISLTITDIAGDILEIDMDAKTVKKNGVSSIASITAGDFFSIDPADQTNFGGGGPSINSSSGAVSVDYRRAWR